MSFLWYGYIVWLELNPFNVFETRPSDNWPCFFIVSQVNQVSQVSQARQKRVIKLEYRIKLRYKFTYLCKKVNLNVCTTLNLRKCINLYKVQYQLSCEFWFAKFKFNMEFSREWQRLFYLFKRRYGKVSKTC